MNPLINVRMLQLPTQRLASLVSRPSPTQGSVTGPACGSWVSTTQLRDCTHFTDAVGAFIAAPVMVATPPGIPATANALASSTAPPGSTLSVASFKVPGFSTPIRPGTGLVPLIDTATGTLTGTLDLKPDGGFAFTPASGYVGPAPPVTVTVASSDGQSKDVPLSLTVNALLRDGNEFPTVLEGSGPIALNVLDNAVVPAGTTARVVGFSVAGSSVVYPTGAQSVAVTDPITGKVAGMVVMQPSGVTAFTPAAAYTGQVPAIIYTVEGSDGQISPGALSACVLPGMVGRACEPGAWVTVVT